ncbi:MAG: lactate utilization protein [Alistipes shahii]
MQNETPDFPTRLGRLRPTTPPPRFREPVRRLDLAEAGRRLRDEIARCAPRSISYGDSMTLRATGIVEELRNGSRYEFIDGFDPALPRPEQLEVRRKGLLADFFMTGVNAVTLGGSLYWVDMVGNRTAPVIFWPRRVVLLAGRNKIVDTQADAERRVQQIAGPKNVARHTGFRTPCAVTGLCRLQLAAAHLQLARMASNGVIPPDEFSCC